ncbi:Glycosyl transferase [Parasponia andersonii]|uniref:Glycosyl transferase n=1 Tax=Parasponia andersonii TaxID=3476 RepID=A0A2P5C5Q0_PARAD|nr:Glycosyl transferase [Parasponia andersonii]
MPLFFHRISHSLPLTSSSSSSSSYSSKTLKPRKPDSIPLVALIPLPITVFSDVEWPKILSEGSTPSLILGSSAMMELEPSSSIAPKLLGFVGIQTGFSSADRRAALRTTWFPSNPDGLLRLEQATDIAFRFVIGQSKDAKYGIP